MMFGTMFIGHRVIYYVSEITLDLGTKITLMEEQTIGMFFWS